MNLTSFLLTLLILDTLTKKIYTKRGVGNFIKVSKGKSIFLTFSFLLLGSTKTASAADYYVSLGGSDLNSGSISSPFKTISKGIAVAQDGDTLFIKSGTHNLNGYSTTLNKSISLIGDDKYTTVLTNGNGFKLIKGITIKNLTFSNFNNIIFQIFVGSGQMFSDFYVENSIFRDSVGFVYDNTSLGSLTNIKILNSHFENIISSANTYVVRLSSGSEISNVLIDGNMFRNIKTTGLTNKTEVLHLGDQLENYQSRFHHITVSNNQFDTIVAAVGPLNGNIEGHALLGYGSYFTVHNNSIIGLNEGSDHEAIYLKATNSVISENFIDGGDGGLINKNNGASITIKGENSDNNKIIGNKIVSSSSASGTGILVEKGSYEISNNYIKLPTGWWGVYPCCSTASQKVLLSNNYIETQGNSSNFYLVENGEISNNALISYSGDPIRLSSSALITVYNNKTCKGGSCASLLPSNSSCQNTGNYCVLSCDRNRIYGYDASCIQGVCCDTKSYTQTATVSTAIIKQGDANNDDKINELDYSIWLKFYRQIFKGFTYGDFNDNGIVDGVDYVIWLNNFNK